jgi:hypothetical protein
MAITPHRKVPRFLLVNLLFLGYDRGDLGLEDYPAERPMAATSLRMKSKRK